MERGQIIKVLVVITGAYLCWSLGKSALELAQAGGRVKQAEMEFDAAKAENERLKELVVWVGTPEFVEREARDKLNMQLPGEQVVVLRPNEEGDKKENGGAHAQEEKNWQKWAKVFGFGETEEKE